MESLIVCCCNYRKWELLLLVGFTGAWAYVVSFNNRRF
jgi:hypothetical protein